MSVTVKFQHILKPIVFLDAFRNQSISVFSRKNFENRIIFDKLTNESQGLLFLFHVGLIYLSTVLSAVG